MRKDKSLWFLVVIIVLQCGTMFYWASQKAYYYIDELFTFEYVQNINNHKDSIEYIDDSPLWKVEEWLHVSDLKTRFTMEEGESVFDLPISGSVKKLFFDRNYMWIINALETVFGRGGPPKWICIGFNILVWIVFQLLLFFFLDSCLGFDRRTTLLAVIMWGFCPLVLGLSVYCRFYAWTLLLLLVVIVLHKLMWDGESHKQNIIYEAVAIFTLYLAFKNSELIFVLGGALVFFFTLGLIARKRYCQALYYSAPLIGGGLFFIIEKSSLLSVILHPARFAAKEIGAAALHTDFLINTSWVEKANSLKHSIKSFSDSVPGSVETTLIIILLGLVLYLSVRRKANLRLGGFSMILIAIAFVYWLFCGLCGFLETRYNSFLFLLIFILAWSFFDVMVKCHRSPETVYKIAACIVIVVAVMPFYRRNVQYVYEWLEPSIERIHEYGDLKSVVNYDPAYNYNVYYSTSLLKESSLIYPVCQNTSDGILPDLPDTFLYWETYYWSPEETLNLIKEAGYTTDLMYDAGLALVYLCQKNEKTPESVLSL
ncbi:MAG: hypothetical protein J5907_06725 [Bacteroidales bacterium]|nr:hypothetical protein [Bacteroidales bacterium]